MKRQGSKTGEGESFIHCTLLGDGMVGKTSLVLSHTQRHFREEYTATVFDNYSVSANVGGQDYVLSVFDTAGQSDYEAVRAHTLDASEVLVLCFSVCERQTLQSVVTTWLPEIQRHSKTGGGGGGAGARPLLLVGTHTDLRPLSMEPATPLAASPLPASTAGAASPPSSSRSSRSSSTSSFSFPSSNSFSSSTFFCSSFTSSSPPPAPQTSSSSSSSPSCSRSPSSVSSTSTASDASCSSLTSAASSPSIASTSSSRGYVSRAEGERVARLLGAECYVETSAPTGAGAEQVFQNVVLAALRDRKRKSSLRGKLGLSSHRRMSSKSRRDLEVWLAD